MRTSSHNNQTEPWLTSPTSYLTKSVSKKIKIGALLALTAFSGTTLASALAGAVLGVAYPPTLAAPAKAAPIAEVMRSTNYEIQLGHFNMTSGEKSSDGYKVTDTVGQTAAGEFNSSGYNVYAGFQYLYALSEFSFRISDLSIDLGELQPGVLSTGTNQLIISTRSGGYTIYAGAIHPLQLKSDPSLFIPNTNCGGGCTISSAGVWTNPNQVGFGFNVTGDNVSSDFVDSTYFRPFANRALPQDHQVIASTSQKVTDEVIDVIYQATIDNSQAGGHYETAIEYLALPSY